MKEYVQNMKKYVENKKDYVQSMKKYVNILDLALSYKLWDLEIQSSSPI